MKREQFIGFIEHPELMDNNTLPLLRKLANEFPYSQPIHTLLAKNLHNENSIHYGNQLKITAAHIPDRTILYNFIHHSTQKKKSTTEPIASPAEQVVKGKEDTDPLKKIIIGSPKRTDISKKESLRQETEKNIPNSLPETKQKKEDVETQTQKTSIDFVREALQKRLQEIVTEKREKTPESAKTKKIASQPPVTNLPNKDNSIPEQKTTSPLQPYASSTKKTKAPLTPTKSVQKTIVPTIQKVLENTSSNEMESHSFIEWLKIYRKIPINISIDNNPDNKQPLQDTPKEIVETKESATKKPVKSTSEIIDNFIAERPRIIPSKATFYSPVNMAKQSVNENENIASATLADIYKKQGNYMKALSMYENLSLKYPEKSSYFAAHIVEVNKLMQKNR